MFAGFGRFVPMIRNLNLDDTQVEQIIDQAIEECSAEIRAYLLTERRIEQDSQQRNKEIEAERQRNAEEIRKHRENEAELSRKRNEQLLAAEAMPPAPRRNREW